MYFYLIYKDYSLFYLLSLKLYTTDAVYLIHINKRNFFLSTNQHIKLIKFCQFAKNILFKKLSL